MCFCGDPACGSCGPAQGFGQCDYCHRVAVEDGLCEEHYEENVVKPMDPLRAELHRQFRERSRR